MVFTTKPENSTLTIFHKILPFKDKIHPWLGESFILNDNELLKKERKRGGVVLISFTTNFRRIIGIAKI